MEHRPLIQQTYALNHDVGWNPRPVLCSEVPPSGKMTSVGGQSGMPRSSGRAETLRYT
jgi:hypothetical protein